MSNNKKYKGLVAFDLDHTLLDHNTWKITPSTLESIEKLKNNDYLVIIASGRDMKNNMSIGYLREVDPDALVHMNGTMVEVKDDVLMDRVMDKDLLKRLLTYCDHENFPIGCRINEMDYFINHEEVLWFDKNYYGIYQGRNFRDPWELLKLPVRSLAFYGSREKSFVLQDAFPELSVMLFSKNFGADVVEAEYSKARGIDRLCEHFGIDKKDTFAFGDSLNDIEMLKMVNVGVAMGNAQDEAKAVADYITDRIDEDGIRNALVHFGLI
ncbi:Cof-type HAD-IIB family hydrolase [Oribacterium sp. FC2011]|uniref:Cof-type HAD-IIB family hydrolase n=1 Tax=Oribacterium sp. FC2011 TaxID=1408311 RepID=UPI0004E1D99E|nr:Cof-type HAD-IIB family hydrolase [Oribacterium sp. FC2011]